MKVEEQSWTAEDAFEPDLEHDSKMREGLDGLMEDDIIEDPSYQYEDDFVREENADDTSSESTLTLCPVCSTVFDEEDDVRSSRNISLRQ